ncbi:four helix bundle protein [Victivallis vadensis]|uniref:Four helix bundle protein n=1 Tax=Victivallis vadensis TaxID=172901 RepID=A0A2U1B991_9BACT|nr:four helix bundle protein [Victivallis vadensis]NMD89425.1 four helix bundle protein [Victivallis vadensis]PVY45233.1 four helix bundle protein [Victivallis vadensis]
MKSFEELTVWKRSCRMTVELYKSLRSCNDCGLKGQMTRAAVSIPSNIAEGAERRTHKEFINFLAIAKGSAAELRTQIYIASEVGIMTREDCRKFTEELKEISRMLQGLIASLSS